MARNRLMKAAMTERLSTYSPDSPKEHGIPTDSLINLYEKWGNGGFGMILTGNVPVDPLHLEGPGNLLISKENDSPKLRAQLKRHAKACKADGALAVVQLTHGGRQTPTIVNPHPRSSSDIQLKGKTLGLTYGKPIPLTEEEIQSDVVERFTFAAEVCHQAGFDGVELHGGHGHLLAQFISPTTNKRTDKYGGNAENRIRIVLEIYDSIRSKIPQSSGFLVGLKMNSVEFQEEGLKTNDAKRMCELIDEKGFDFVDMCGGTYEKHAFEHQPESTKIREAFFLKFTDQIRSALKSTKMYVTGGFRTVKWMVKAIEDGNCDGVGLGRPVTAEPDLPRKILNFGVLAAADTKINQKDHAITIAASMTQIWQAGRFPVEKIQKVTDGIMDLSIQTLATRYLNESKIFMAEIGKKLERGEPVSGVFEFESNIAV
ncbi:unnamed protein product, partial [Mesorhabditis belari]|uniref:NADH:flavin oxidoreductase/NADH oxidase N-terminal domain-containing protein n=1 Tax=Mesorhabditis belari TaxID=2138241 RepID=A0AAF3FHW7_9BILA